MRDLCQNKDLETPMQDEPQKSEPSSANKKSRKNSKISFSKDVKTKEDSVEDDKATSDTAKKSSPAPPHPVSHAHTKKKVTEKFSKCNCSPLKGKKEENNKSEILDEKKEQIERNTKYSTDDEKKQTKSHVHYLCPTCESKTADQKEENKKPLTADRDKKLTDEREESAENKCSLQCRKHNDIIRPHLGKRGSQLLHLASSGKNNACCQIDSEEKKVEVANLSKKEHEIARQNYEAACEAAQKAREERLEKAMKEKQALLEQEKNERAEQVKKAKEELIKKEAEQKEMRKKLYEQALAKAEEEKAAKEKRLALKKKREEEWAKRLQQKDQNIQEKKINRVIEKQDALKQPTEEKKGSKINSILSQPPSKETSQTEMLPISSKSQTPPKAPLSPSNLQEEAPSPQDDTAKESDITSPVESKVDTLLSPKMSQLSSSNQSRAHLLQDPISEQTKVTSSKGNQKTATVKGKPNLFRNAVRKFKPRKLPKLLLERSVEPARSPSDEEDRLKPHRWPKYRKKSSE